MAAGGLPAELQLGRRRGRGAADCADQVLVDFHGHGAIQHFHVDAVAEEISKDTAWGSHNPTLSRSRTSATWDSKMADPLVQLRQFGGETVLRDGRAGHNALQARRVSSEMLRAP